MNPIHVAFAMTFPDIRYDFSLRRLFRMLDSFDVRQRQEVLEAAYFCFDCNDDDRTSGDERWRQKWYEQFRKTFVKANAGCGNEAYVVYGLVSYVLARALQKGDVGRFTELMKQHRQWSEDMEEYAKQEEAEQVLDEEGTIIDAASSIEHSKKSIESLHKELEDCKIAYNAFCEQIVKPLLEQQEPSTLPPGPPPSRN